MIKAVCLYYISICVYTYGLLQQLMFLGMGFNSIIGCGLAQGENKHIPYWSSIACSLLQGDSLSGDKEGGEGS